MEKKEVVASRSDVFVINEAAGGQSPNMPQIISLSNLYKVLSSKSRLQILCVLSNGDKCVFEIAECTHTDMSAVSHQLKILKDANLVTSLRVGKKIYYSLADDHVSTILIHGFGHISEYTT